MSDAASPPRMLVLGDRVVDLATGRVLGHGRLRPMEQAFLAYLADRPGRTVPLEQILRDVWNYAPSVHSRTVYVTVGRLRKLVEPDPEEPRFVVAHRGGGYALRGARWVERALGAEAEVPTAPLVGREAEISVALHHAGLVALVGPAAVGKTHLAREIGRRGAFPGGVWVVALGEVGVDGLDAAVVAALPGAAETAGERLAALGRSLVVLDDVDRVGAALEDRLASWRARAPSARFVATGRARPRVRGERVVEVGPLPRSEAVELLRACLGPERTVTDADLAELAAEVDHRPGFLEIVAENVGLLGASTVLEALRRGRDLRRRGSRGPPSLHAAVADAWRSADPAEQHALAVLAALDDAVGDRGAARLLGPSALDLLASLVERNLLTAIAVDGDTRFEVGRVERAFSRAQGQVDPNTALDALIAWCVEHATAAAPQRLVTLEPRWRLPVGLATLRAVIARAEARSDLGDLERDAVAAATSARARELGQGDEGATWALRRAVATRDLSGRSELHAEVALWKGSVGRVDEAEAAWTEAVGWAARSGTPRTRVAGHVHRGLLRATRGDRDGARSDADALFSLASELPADEEPLARGLGHAVLSRLHTFSDDDDHGSVEQARLAAAACRTVARGEQTARIIELSSTPSLGQLGLYQEVLAITTSVLAGAADDPRGPLAGHAWIRRGMALARLGRHDEVLECARRARVRCAPPRRSAAAYLAADASLALDDLDAAVRWYTELVALPAESEWAEACRRMGAVRLAQIERGVAAAAAVARRIGRTPFGSAHAQLVWTLFDADFQGGAGDPELALELLGSALTGEVSSPETLAEAVILGAELSSLVGGGDAWLGHVSALERSDTLPGRRWAESFVALRAGQAPPPWSADELRAESLLSVHHAWYAGRAGRVVEPVPHDRLSPTRRWLAVRVGAPSQVDGDARLG